MKLIYLAGAYTKHPLNLPRFIGTPLNVLTAWRYSYKLWAKGFYVLCPITNTAFMDKASPYETFMEGCFEEVKRCDALYLLPNWHCSSGAIRELKLALSLNMPIRLLNPDNKQKGIEKFRSVVEEFVNEFDWNFDWAAIDL